MSRRVDGEILERTWQDNQETLSKWKSIRERFDQLRAELKSAATTKLTYLDEPSSSESAERVEEVQEWNAILRPYVEQGDTWLSAPWMVAEFYVYRRLMDCLGYFDQNSVGYQYDPFERPKRAGLHSSVTSAETMLGKLLQLPSNKEGLEIAASIALWGNKMDLSLWPADLSQQNQDVFSSILDQAHENLLHDDSDALANYCERLRDKGGGRVDIIVDNAGFELVTDLALAQHLIASGIAKTVTFQLKSHPTFVSDAQTKDLMETVDYYVGLDATKFPNAQKCGQLWKNYIDNGQWKLQEDRFWVQGVAMWEMRSDLYDELQKRCDLAFSKGDANYRRLLGDREWDYTANFQDVVGCYFPCPICALRTLKAELGCGMDKEQVERAKELDDQWLVNGRFGVVQFGYKD